LEVRLIVKIERRKTEFLNVSQTTQGKVSRGTAAIFSKFAGLASDHGMLRSKIKEKAGTPVIAIRAARSREPKALNRVDAGKEYIKK